MAAVAAVHSELAGLNTQALAISTDSVFSHKVFLETSPSLKNVRYPLVSDRNQEISKAYRVLDEKSGASFRASFFIDPNQIIRAKFIYPREVGRNLDEHIRLLKGLHYSQKTGEGVPANWKPGESGIIRDPNNIGKI
ncbi:peroxiredoxin [Bacillus sp. EB600]|nr:peroxiredoxin [Bacillus sp. EB600]